jgi:hypothetical protein
LATVLRNIYLFKCKKVTRGGLLTIMEGRELAKGCVSLPFLSECEIDLAEAFAVGVILLSTLCDRVSKT